MEWVKKRFAKRGRKFYSLFHPPPSILEQKLKTLEVFKKEVKDVKNLTYYKQELFILTLYGGQMSPCKKV